MKSKKLIAPALYLVLFLLTVFAVFAPIRFFYLKKTRCISGGVVQMVLAHNFHSEVKDGDEILSLLTPFLPPARKPSFHFSSEAQDRVVDIKTTFGCELSSGEKIHWAHPEVFSAVLTKSREENPTKGGFIDLFCNREFSPKQAAAAYLTIVLDTFSNSLEDPGVSGFSSDEDGCTESEIEHVMR